MKNVIVKDYHIHFYYNAELIQKAKILASLAAKKFNIKIGKFHEKAVGPHPMWSVQLLIPPHLFGEVLSWVSLNRQGLIVFSHPNTGNDLLDHTDHAIWMGDCLNLNLSIFRDNEKKHA